MSNAERAEAPPVEEGSAPLDGEAIAEEEARVERRFAFLAEQVRAQAVDDEWAATATDWIEAAAIEFPSTRFVAIDCRTTLCQVEVEHENARASEYFQNFFFPRLPGLPHGALRRVRTASGTPGSVVVLAKAGYAVPRLEEP